MKLTEKDRKKLKGISSITRRGFNVLRCSGRCEELWFSPSMGCLFNHPGCPSLKSAGAAVNCWIKEGLVDPVTRKWTQKIKTPKEIRSNLRKKARQSIKNGTYSVQVGYSGDICGFPLKVFQMLLPVIREFPEVVFIFSSSDLNKFYKTVKDISWPLNVAIEGSARNYKQIGIQLKALHKFPIVDKRLRLQPWMFWHNRFAYSLAGISLVTFGGFIGEKKYRMDEDLSVDQVVRILDWCGKYNVPCDVRAFSNYIVEEGEKRRDVVVTAMIDEMAYMVGSTPEEVRRNLYGSKNREGSLNYPNSLSLW